MKDKIFSIIVPVYNVEKYIKQCVESILNQTYTNFEVIFIDDKGNDKSIDIIKKYAKTDKRIKILTHDRNKGLSASRNTGLKASIGKYILCVDSDDWLESNCLQKIYDAFQYAKTESIWFNSYKFDDNTQKRIENIEEKQKRGYLTITPQNICNCSDYTWTKAYTRESIVKYHLNWPEGLTFEDAEFYFKYFTFNPNTFVLEECLYNYRQRQGSIVTNAQKGNVKIEDIYQIVKNIVDFYIKQNLFTKYKKAILQLVGNRINLCKQAVNNYEKSLKLSKDLISYINFPKNFEECKITDKPIFSVIVPVYNVEKYVKQCIKSIQNQSFFNFEIIVIDDCGKDNSMKIVEELSKNDNRIRIIKHKKNLGLGAARNTGLENSLGEYIVCVDSDDWLLPNCLEELYSTFNKTGLDCIWYKANVYWEEHHKYSTMFFFKYFDIHPQRHIKLDNNNLTKFPLYSWNKAYRKNLLTANNIKWPEGILFEDVEFYFKTHICSPNIYILNKALYMYRRRETSIIGDCTKNAEKAKDLFKATYNVYQYLNKNNLMNEYSKSFLKYVGDVINMFRQYPETQKQLYPTIKQFLSDINFPEEYNKITIKPKSN